MVTLTSGTLGKVGMGIRMAERFAVARKLVRRFAGKRLEPPVNC